MTVGQALDLRNKKINSRFHNEELLEKLFKLGVRWATDSSNMEKMIGIGPFFFISENLELEFVDALHYEDFIEHKYEEISADEIPNIRIKEQIPIPNLIIPL